MSEAPIPAEEDFSEEEIEVLRSLLKASLSERAVERAFTAKEMKKLRKKHAMEKRKREAAYITVARLRSVAANLRLRIKGIPPCSPAT